MATPNNQGERREAAAADARLRPERNGCLTRAALSTCAAPKNQILISNMRTNISRLAFPLFAAVLLVTGTTARSAVFWDQASLDAGRELGASHDYDFLGRLTMQSLTGTHSASFSMVDPWHAITAAHAFLQPSGDIATSATATFGENVFTSPLLTVGVSSWVTHPSYSAGAPVGSAYDVAVITFDRPITEVTSIPIYSGSLAPVFIANVAGYGRPGIAGNGLGEFVGDRYAGVTTIGDDYWPYAGPQYLIGGFSLYSGGADHLLGTPGDSGGACAIDVAGHLELVGVIDFDLNINNYGSGSLTGYLNLTDPVSRDWVLSQVPEPSSSAIAGIGLSLLLLFLHSRPSVAA